MSRTEGQPVSFKAKAVTFIALTGASLGVIRCANAENHQDPTRPTEPAATRQLTPKETATLTHEALSTNQPPATATLAELTVIEQDVLDQDHLKAEFSSAYGDPTISIPSSACTLETMTKIIDQIYSSSGTLYDFASGLVYPYMEARDLSVVVGSNKAGQLATGIKDLAMSKIDEYGAVNKFSQTDIDSLKHTWTLNAARESSITNPAGCTITAESKP